MIRERGFSLIELLVAMVMTLIVSGAIYGLLASGQGAFRREPALVDRQQNIRVALDLLARDVENAGVGMTPFAQVFSPGLNNPGTALGSAPSEIVAGERADFLQMMVNDGSCPSLSVCGSPGGQLFTTQILPACLFGTGAGFGFVSGSAGTAFSNPPSGIPPGVLWIDVPGPGAGSGCGDGHVGLPSGGNDINPGGNAACDEPTPGATPGSNNYATPYCQSVSKIEFVRYEIAPENPALAWNPTMNPYCLWRSGLGRRNTDATVNNGPHTGANSPWQLVARGIEDMQVDYQDGNRWPATPNVWDPVPAAAAGYPQIVRRLRVTFSGRAVGANLGGETQGAVTAGRRGQLTTILTPRAALQALSAASPGPNPSPWR